MYNKEEIKEQLAKKKIELEDRKSGVIKSTKEEIEQCEGEIKDLEKQIRPRRTAFLDECAG